METDFHLKALNLADVKKKEDKQEIVVADSIQCLLCDAKFELIGDNTKSYLAHLLASHRLVIAEINQIGDFKRYNTYWRERLRDAKISVKDICFEIRTNSGQNDKFESESYFLLSDDLPEDKKLREDLNIFKLVSLKF